MSVETVLTLYGEAVESVTGHMVPQKAGMGWDEAG